MKDKLPPRPWKGLNNRVYDASGELIATVDAWMDTPSHATANLIAAAPDLLESLKEILPWMLVLATSNCPTPDIREHINRAKAAIAKASGKGAPR